MSMSSATTIVLPEALQVFLLFLSQGAPRSVLHAMHTRRGSFADWLATDAAKAHASNVVDHNNTIGASSRTTTSVAMPPLNFVAHGAKKQQPHHPKSASSSGLHKHTRGDSKETTEVFSLDISGESAEVSADAHDVSGPTKGAICSFTKLFVDLLSEMGYPISAEVVIPANSAAMIADQAQVIQSLQDALSEQEKTFREHLRILEATAVQQSLSLTAQSEKDASVSDASPSTSAEAPDGKQPLGRSASAMSRQGSALSRKSTSSSSALGRTNSTVADASAAVTNAPEVKLIEARQECIKLKNAMMVLQKDLQASQRQVADLNQRLKESDDTIDSLEIAFAALETVHKNDKVDGERNRAQGELRADQAIARLTKLAALQGEQLVVAEESRERTQRMHIEELDRIQVAHAELVRRLKAEMKLLYARLAELAERNKELVFDQAALTQKQTATLSNLVKNSVDMVARQYRPHTLLIQVDRPGEPNDAAARNSTSATSLAAAIKKFPLRPSSTATTGSQSAASPRSYRPRSARLY